MNWQVYIVVCRDGSLYTGITTDLQRRLKEHNAGKGAKYTNSRKPVILVTWSDPMTLQDAAAVEYQVKQKPKHKKVEFLERFRKDVK